MRNSIKKAISSSVQDLLNIGFGTSFTERELQEFGVKIPDILIEPIQIKDIREETHLSQRFLPN